MRRKRVMVVSGLAFAGAVFAMAWTPAQARGCKAFGAAVATSAQSGGLGPGVSAVAPANDDIQILQSAFCQ